VKNIAQGQEIISQMNAVPTIRPRGRPAGITVAEDGAIWVLDDVNKALLRVAKGKAYQMPAKKVVPDSNVEVNNTKVAKILVERCQACHHLTGSTEATKIPQSWLEVLDGKTVLERRLFHTPLRPIPPDSPLLKEQSLTLKNWLSTM